MFSGKKKVIFSLLISIFIICLDNFALAEEGQVRGGGIANCTFEGNTPIKTISIADNRFLLLKNLNTNKTQASLNSRDGSSSAFVSIFTFFGYLTDTDVNSLLEGVPFSFMNNGSDLLIDTGEPFALGMPREGITNSFPNLSNRRSKTFGTITIANHDATIVSGKLKLIFKNTVYSIIKDNKIVKVNKNNKRVIVNCDLINIPLADKELIEETGTNISPPN